MTDNAKAAAQLFNELADLAFSKRKAVYGVLLRQESIAVENGNGYFPSDRKAMEKIIDELSDALAGDKQEKRS